MYNLLNLYNPILRAFLFYASILIGKTMIMSPLTARWRFKKRVFISPEDAVLRGTRVGYDDEDIERIRRAHRNDIENIPMFLATGFIYILTDPHPFVAINLFRLYTVCRITHTYVYAIKVYPQPIRAMISIALKLDNDFQITTTAKERIDRIKRARLNDIENIPIFLAITFAYASTEPDPQTASLLLQIFTCARIVHTLVYAVYVLPQPARAAAFITGEIVTWIMIIKTAINFY
ncbi:hypothetical protein V9T40_002051 [Parthenolecanium corni]|uniref:Microsomal glutathione S-transferase 1 n=1 Tax=Parthenolecanium corni TaxID=536013 RepID=A0AAN9TK28_9HEMI